MRHSPLPHLLLLLPLFVCLLTGARAQTTAFTYQDRLNDGPGPANGSYDLRFGLWSAASGPAQVGSTLTTNAVAVTNGGFTVTLDFGHQFPGADRWLEIAVRTNGSGAFATLAPRQIVPTTPYAIHSATAGSVAAANLTGTLPAASIGAGTITSVMLASGTVGSNQLANGAVTPAKLSATVAQLDRVNAFVSGTNSFAGRVGIGTATPGEDLAIQTNTGDTNATAKLSLAANGGRKWIIQSVSGFDTNSTGGGALQFVDTSAGSPVMTLGPDGSLSLNGQPGAPFALNLLDPANNGGTIGIAAGVGQFSSHARSNDVVIRAIPGRLLLQSGQNDSALFINTNNYVGLGTTNPATKLEVLGSVKATAFTGNGVGLTNLNASQLTGTLSTNILGTGRITTEMLANGAVTASKLATASAWEAGALLIANPAQGDSDLFGYSVAAVGTDRLLVGSPQNDSRETDAGAAHLFSLNGTLQTTFTSPNAAPLDNFGWSVAAVGNDRVLIGSPGVDAGVVDTGAAYLFSTNGTLITTFTNPAPSPYGNFGHSLASLGTDRVLIGAFGSGFAGAAHLFSTNGTLLISFTDPAPTSLGRFGFSVAVLGTDRVLIGADGSATGASSAGAAYLFSTNGTLLTTFRNPAPAPSDLFGNSVAVLGTDQVLIGAQFADTGGKKDAGAVYLFNTNATLVRTFTKPDPLAACRT